DFFMRPTSGDFETREGYRPFIADHVIHLPDAYDAVAGLEGNLVYRAAAAHAAAHLVYHDHQLSPQELTTSQRFFIGLAEDARVEHLAASEFPGLRELWLPFHATDAEDEGARLIQHAIRAFLAAGERHGVPVGLNPGFLGGPAETLAAGSSILIVGSEVGAARTVLGDRLADARTAVEEA
ncbi:MAG: hypothetical protein ABEK42_10810, partial [Thiohalorhabdaceae bacterium]